MTDGYKSVDELEQYADQYPDHKAIVKWIEDGVAYYIVHVQMFESAEEREKAEAYSREMFGNLFEMLGEMTGGHFNPDQIRLPDDYYNGYVRFKEMPLSGSKFLDYVPVHGGITYGQRSPDGSYVYGFDTNHAGDANHPDIQSTEWLENECRTMSRGIMAAVRYEQQYIAAKDEDGKKAVLIAFLKYMSEEFGAKGVGTGALLNILSGDL